jgi:glutamyl-tRNA synthetase
MRNLNKRNSITITRFAPSPTGLLHIGNLRTALLSWAYARRENGKFILRIDDTDQFRSKKRYVEEIINDLKWLGIDHDIMLKQSTKEEKYSKIKDLLIYHRKIYPCYESEEELKKQKDYCKEKKIPFIYNRASLNLSIREQRKLIDSGIKPHWRLLLCHKQISWDDGIKGLVSFNGNNLSDPIVVRSDQSITYNLASVIDDIDSRITDILRGEDHITNSAIHIQIFNILTDFCPRFHHISLLKSQEDKISKKDERYSIKALRRAGICKKSIICYIHKNMEKNDYSIQSLSKSLDLVKIGKSPATFRLSELKLLNNKILRCLSFNEVKLLLKDLKHPDICEEFWFMIRNNIEDVSDIKKWYNICYCNIQTKIIDPEIIDIAKNTIPKTYSRSQYWNIWITNIKKHTMKRHKDLFIPLRLAITGRVAGPDMKTLVPFIKKELLLKRLTINQNSLIN